MTRATLHAAVVKKDLDLENIWVPETLDSKTFGLPQPIRTNQEPNAPHKQEGEEEEEEGSRGDFANGRHCQGQCVESKLFLCMMLLSQVCLQLWVSVY